MSDLHGRISHLSSVQLAFAARQIEAKTELMRAEPIAIIGMACRFPGGADDPEAFWRLLQSGADAIAEVPRDRWDIEAYYDPDPQAPGKMYCRCGGFLERADMFDADFFGISPREAVSMDPQQRLLLEVGWEALEHANQPPERLFGSPTGVFVGISTCDYALLRAGLQDRKAIDAYQVSGTNLSVAAGRLSYLLGLNGPCMSVDTACSSSLVGLHLACQSLRNRESALALAAGVGLLLAPEPSINFSKAGMLARDGRCKTFDAAADGYGRGEGCGVVVLKRLADALADGDTVLAVVRGSAVNQDGASGGLTVPSGPSQEAVIRRAVSGAGLDPLQVSYVEAHGTGTALGDPIEINALAAALCRQRPADQPLLVGSVKTNIGHLEAASGIAGVIKTVLALRHRQIPAQLHFKTPNSHMDWENMPLRVTARAADWTPAGGRRIAGVSAFGFSGTNAHVVLEAAPDEIERTGGAVRPLHLLTLSAKTHQALQRLADRYRRHLDAHPDQALADLCFTANTGRSHFGHRLAVVAATPGELKAKLAALQKGDALSGLWRSQKPVQARPQQPLPCAFNADANDLHHALEGLARAYVGGARIDWDQFYAGQAVSKSALPTYPFQRERFWIGPDTGSVAVDAGGPPAGPIALPGRRLHLPMSDDIRFEATLAGTLPAFLADHQLFGKVVVAGAAYVAMLLQAAVEALHQEVVALEEVLLEQALVIGPDSARSVHTVMAPVSEALFDFQVMSRGAENAGEDAWDRHVSGKLRAAGDMGDGAAVPPAADLAALRAAAQAAWETPDATEFYAQIARAGHHLGGSFRWIRDIRQYGRQALCLLQAPDLPGLEGAFPLYPGLIDSCFQFFCIRGRRLWADGSDDPQMADPQDQNATYVPFSLGDVRFYGPAQAPGGRLWCHTAVTAFDEHTQGMTGDIVLFDDQGRTILTISGLKARKLTRQLLVSPQQTRREEHRPDVLYGVAWRPIRIPAVPGQTTAPGLWLIFADSGGAGEALGRSLRAEGQEAVLVFPGSAYDRAEEGHYRVDPAAPADFVRLMDECRGGTPCKGIVHLWSLDSHAETNSGGLEQAQEPAWASVLYLAQALAGGSWEAQPRLWLVTRGAQAVASPEPALCPHQATLWGLAGAIRLEQPQWQCTCIDLGGLNGEDQAPLLFEAIRSAGAEDRIALRGQASYGARIVPLDLPRTGGWSARSDATYLITGGLGALGLETAHWLAARGAGHLVLVGRGPGAAAARARVDKLQRAGAHVKILPADIAARSEVERMLRELSGLPPLKGIVHAAGVLDDALLAGQDMERFGRVMAPKVAGAWNLHEATRDLPLDFFVCYSSAAALLGSAGQANYAAANAFLDALAQVRRSQGRHGLSVDWGPWELGMAAGLKECDRQRIAAQGFTPLAAAQGFQLLERLLGEDATLAGVLPLNWDAYLGRHYTAMLPPFFEAVAKENPVQHSLSEAQPAIARRLADALAGERPGILLDHVQLQVAVVLQLKRGKRVPADEGLFDHGLDSLMAVELKGRLETDLGRTLPATLVFDHPTIEALAGFLLQEIGPAAETQPLLDRDTGERTVAALSDEIDASIVDELTQLEALLKGN